MRDTAVGRLRIQQLEQVVSNMLDRLHLLLQVILYKTGQLQFVLRKLVQAKGTSQKPRRCISLTPCESIRLDSFLMKAQLIRAPCSKEYMNHH